MVQIQNLWIPIAIGALVILGILWMAGVFNKKNVLSNYKPYNPSKENYLDYTVNTATGYPQWLLNKYLLIPTAAGGKKTKINVIGRSFDLRQWDSILAFDDILNLEKSSLYPPSFYDLYIDKNTCLKWTASNSGIKLGDPSFSKTTNATQKTWGSEKSLSLGGAFDDITFGLSTSQVSGGTNDTKNSLQTSSITIQNAIGSVMLNEDTSTSGWKQCKYANLDLSINGMLYAFLTILPIGGSALRSDKTFNGGSNGNFNYYNKDTGENFFKSFDVSDITFWSNQQKFFNSFGTHVCTEIDFGAKLYLLNTIVNEENEYTDYLQSKLCANVKSLTPPATTPTSGGAASGPAQSPEEKAYEEAATAVTKAESDFDLSTYTTQMKLDAALTILDDAAKKLIKGIDSWTLDDDNSNQVISEEGAQFIIKNSLIDPKTDGADFGVAMAAFQAALTQDDLGTAKPITKWNEYLKAKSTNDGTFPALKTKKEEIESLKTTKQSTLDAWNKAKDPANQASQQQPSANGDWNIQGCIGNKNTNAGQTTLKNENSWAEVYGGTQDGKTNLNGLTIANLASYNEKLQVFLKSVNADPNPKNSGSTCGGDIYSFLDVTGNNYCHDFCGPQDTLSDSIKSYLQVLAQDMENMIQDQTWSKNSVFEGTSIATNAQSSLEAAYDAIQPLLVEGTLYTVDVNIFGQKLTKAQNDLAILLPKLNKDDEQGQHVSDLLDSIKIDVLPKIDEFTKTLRVGGVAEGSCLDRGYLQYLSTSSDTSKLPNPPVLDQTKINTTYGVKTFQFPTADMNSNVGVINLKFKSTWDFCSDAAKVLITSFLLGKMDNLVPAEIRTVLQTIKDRFVATGPTGRSDTRGIQYLVKSISISLQTFYVVFSPNSKACPINLAQNQADHAAGIPPQTWLKMSPPSPSDNSPSGWGNALQYDCMNANLGCTQDKDCMNDSSWAKYLTGCYPKMSGVGYTTSAYKKGDKYPFACGDKAPQVTENGPIQYLAPGDNCKARGVLAPFNSNPCYCAGGGGRYKNHTIFSTANDGFCGSG